MFPPSRYAVDNLRILMPREMQVDEPLLVEPPGRLFEQCNLLAVILDNVIIRLQLSNSVSLNLYRRNVNFHCAKLSKSESALGCSLSNRVDVVISAGRFQQIIQVLREDIWAWSKYGNMPLENELVAHCHQIGNPKASYN